MSKAKPTPNVFKLWRKMIERAQEASRYDDSTSAAAFYAVAADLEDIWNVNPDNIRF